MSNFERLHQSVYPAAFFRAYRSLQWGESPNRQDVELAAAQGWMLPSGIALSNQPNCKVEAMVESDRFEIVHHWLEQTEDWIRVRASYAEGTIYEATGILVLAQTCEWAILADVSALPLTTQGKLHPIGLDLGWGSPSEAYSHHVPHSASVYFFNAYRSSDQ